MKVLLYLLPILLTCSLKAQQNCSCGKALDSIIAKIESSYPGFEQKTKDKVLYEHFKAGTVKAARSATDSNCLPVLKQYVDFFRDRHIWVLPRETMQPQQTAVAKAVTANINLSKFKKEILKSKDALEGIWKDEKYEVGIKKISDKEYAGFIIKADPSFWKPNEIKFRLFTDGSYEYYLQDHSVQKATYKLHNNSFIYFDLLRSVFVRQLPAAVSDASAIEDKVNEINGFSVRQLTPRTTLITLRFFSQLYIETIDRMIEKNKTLIENSEFLIVDVRDNGGGVDNAYRSILPYIQTGITRSIGAEFLSSATLIGTWSYHLEELKKDPVKNKEEIETQERRIAMLKANPGKYVDFAGNKVWLDTPQLAARSPKQVVVLANNVTASAAENFLLKARQSRKVKIIGTPSSGVLDYANAMWFEYGCSNYKLLMPTYRSQRLPGYPIDNIGVQPDIYLDDSEKDWIQYAVKYLEY